VILARAAFAAPGSREPNPAAGRVSAFRLRSLAHELNEPLSAAHALLLIGPFGPSVKATLRAEIAGPCLAREGAGCGPHHSLAISGL